MISYQSLILPEAVLRRFRDIAFDMSSVAIFG